MKKLQKQKLKQIVSCIVGVPAAIIAFSEPENEYWYIPFVAWGIVIAILKWNNIIKLNRSKYEY